MKSFFMVAVVVLLGVIALEVTEPGRVERWWRKVVYAVRPDKQQKKEEECRRAFNGGVAIWGHNNPEKDVAPTIPTTKPAPKKPIAPSEPYLNLREVGSEAQRRFGELLEDPS